MKRFLLLFITTLCGVSAASGQITIQRSDLPILNDSVRITNTDISGINYTATGPDYKWDFSQLPKRSEEAMEYKAALQTDYRLYFLHLNYFGLKGEDLTIRGYGFKDIYNFYEIDNSKYGVKGIGMKFQDAPLAAVYSKLDKIFSLPLRYAQKDSNQYAFKVDIPSLGSYKGDGVRVTEADGWGEITTPYGTFACIRTKSVVNGTDSILASVLGFEVAFGIPVAKVEYQWWAKNQKVPVMSVEGRMVGNNFVPTKTYYKGIEINPPATSVRNHQLEKRWNIWPLSGQIGWRVEVPAEYLGSDLSIMQLNGQLLKTIKLNQLVQEISLMAPSGMYIAVLSNEEGISSRKVLLSR